MDKQHILLVAATSLVEKWSNKEALETVLRNANKPTIMRTPF